MRRACLFSAIAVLSACQTVPKPPHVQPIACRHSLMAALSPQPLVPESAAQMAFDNASDSLIGAESYMAYVEKLARWGRDGWTRAATAKVFCEGAR